MSHVTNVILTFSIMEAYDEADDTGDDIYRVMIHVNEWLTAHGHQPFRSTADVSAGGDKCLEVPIFVAAFNYWRLDEFVAMLRSLSWEYPQCVQLFVLDQDDEKFTLIEPFLE